MEEEGREGADHKEGRGGAERRRPMGHADKCQEDEPRRTDMCPDNLC